MEIFKLTELKTLKQSPNQDILTLTGAVQNKFNSKQQKTRMSRAKVMS